MKKYLFPDPTVLKSFWRVDRFAQLRFSWLKFDFALVSSVGHSNLWTQSAKLTADSIRGHDELTRLAGLAGLVEKIWDQYGGLSRTTEDPGNFLVSVFFNVVSRKSLITIMVGRIVGTKHGL